MVRVSYFPTFSSALLDDFLFWVFSFFLKIWCCVIGSAFKVEIDEAEVKEEMVLCSSSFLSLLAEASFFFWAINADMGEFRLVTVGDFFIGDLVSSVVGDKGRKLFKKSKLSFLLEFLEAIKVSSSNKSMSSLRNTIRFIFSILSSELIC